MDVKKLAIFVFFVALIVVGRLIDHPANFTPVIAASLFGAIYLGKNFAAPIALAGMISSDIVIGFYDWRLMLAVYGSFVIIAAIGRLLSRESNWFSIAGASVSGSLVFFFITNAAVWYFGPHYSHDWTGLSHAYFMGLPFLKNSLIGDLFYTGGLYALLKTVSRIPATPILKRSW